MPFSEIAVLYRANFQSRVLEEEFLTKDVPYQVLGTRFFERKEIKDILAFLRFSFNPESIADLKKNYKCATARHRQNYLVKNCGR